jgi:hypothetical protein
MQCYYYKTLYFKSGIFDDIIDCTFILTLENSSRDPIKKIKEIPTSKTVIIQYNKGYKNCKKNILEEKTYCDLSDAYYKVFNFANNNNMKNILVLEDDFIFDKKIKTKNVLRDIKNLYSNKPVNIFQLGTVGYVLDLDSILYKKYNCFKLFYCGLAHAVIYSQEFRNVYMKSYQKLNKCKHFDTYLNKFYVNNIYTYRTPLAYQILHKTDNSDTWKEVYGSFIEKFVHFFIKYFNLDKNTKEWKRLYAILYMLNVFFYVIIVILIILFIKFIYKIHL